jgi:peptidoglycan/xylan/chitin deacetylase (PgdA/CDA1 family)
VNFTKWYTRSILMVFLITLLLPNYIVNVYAAEEIANNTLYSECEDINEWSPATGIEYSIDRIEKASMLGSLKASVNRLVASNEYFIPHRRSDNLDFTSFEKIEFNFFVSNIEDLDAFAVFLVKDSSNFFHKYFGSEELVKGWNRIEVPRGSFTQHGKLTWNEINSVTFKLEAKAGKKPSVNIDKIVLNPVKPPKPILPDNYVLSEFEDSSEWKVRRDCTVSLDLENKFSQKGSLKMSTNSSKILPSPVISYSKELDYNFKNIRNASLSMYIPNKEDLVSVAFRLIDDSDNYYYYYFGEWEMFKGWNNFSIAKEDFHEYGIPNWDSIEDIRIEIEPKPGKKPIINLDRLQFNNIGKTRILFTFDDASQSVRTFGYPILEEYGFKATTWANMNLSTYNAATNPNDYVEKFISEEGLKELYENGWDIGNHTISHNDYLDELPTPQMKYEIHENQKWLLGLGFDRSAYHICYPMGNFDKEITEYLPTIGTRTGRTTVHGLQSSKVEDIYTLRTIAAGKDTSPAYINKMVDRAVATGTSIIFMFHEVTPNPVTNLEISVENTKLIVDHIKKLSDQNKLKVQTISQWYDEYIIEYPESIPSNYIESTETVPSGYMPKEYTGIKLPEKPEDIEEDTEELEESETSEAHEILELTEVPTIPESNELAEFPKLLELPDLSEDIEVPNVSEIIETVDVPEASESTSATVNTINLPVDITGHWGEEAIENLLNSGIIDGYPDQTVRPNNKITRAEISVLISKALGLEGMETSNRKFVDNNGIPTWSREFVNALLENNVINGYDDNTFRADNYVTRNEIAVLLLNAFGFEPATGIQLQFSDENNIPNWSYGHIVKAKELGIVNGYSDNSYRAKNCVTRAEVFVMLARSLELHTKG